MCALAPRAATATEFLDRQRGVVAAMAPASSERKTGDQNRRSRAVEVSTAAGALKRGRHDHDVADTAPSSSAPPLRVRMDKELVALQGLIKRAKLLPSAPAAEKKCTSAPAPVAAKRRASPLKPATEAAAHAPAKQRAPAKNTIALEVHSKQIPAEAPASAAKQQHQHPVQQRAAAAKMTEVPKKWRWQQEKEPARAIVVWNSATTREEFRQMLLEMEKSAMPDETIYPEELEALGIPFEFVITRTWKQAMEDHAKAKKAELVGV